MHLDDAVPPGSLRDLSPDVLTAIRNDITTGMSNRAIAKRYQVSTFALRKFRKNLGVPSFVRRFVKPRFQLTEDRLTCLKTALESDLTVHSICAHHGFGKKTVRKYASIFGISKPKRLAVTKKPKIPLQPRRAITARERARRQQLSSPIRPDRDPVFARLKAATAYNLDPSTRFDAIQGMYVDILAGILRLDDVENKARRYTGRAISEYCNRFGPLSLNEAIDTSDQHGRSWIDAVQCERSALQMDIALHRGLFDAEVTI